MTKNTSKKSGAGAKPAAKRTTTTKPKTANKAASKAMTKPKAPVHKKGQTAAAKRGKTAVAPKKNIFAGASEVSVTENKIAVTKINSQSAKGKYRAESTRTYHDKTPANMKTLNEVMNGRQVKKVTVKFKN